MVKHYTHTSRKKTKKQKSSGIRSKEKANDNGKGNLSNEIIQENFPILQKEKTPQHSRCQESQISINREEFLSARNGKDKHVVFSKILYRNGTYRMNLGAGVNITVAYRLWSN